MKTSLHILLAALAATAALVGCTKEITPNFENDKVNPAAEGSRVIAVSFAPQTKTYLDKDGFQPKFNDEDSILISNGEALDTCAVDVNGDKATISTDLTGPLTAVYPYKAAKMNESNLNQIDTVLVSTEQSGKFADANICMAKMTSENDESLSFENKTALFKIIPGAGADTKYVEVSAKDFNIANDVLTGSEFKNYDKIHVATTTADSVYVSILVPEGLTVGSLSFSDGTNVKTIKDERASIAIAAGALYTVTNENWESPEADIPEPLKGKFSVSADKQVQFSQGNLVATINESGTPTAWKFATNQYDYLGASGANKTIGSAGGDVDLFGWSTSSTTYGISTSTSDSDYSGDFKDFGEAYCESNSIAEGTWRTLSKDEWCYLFAYNPETSQFIEESPRYNLHKTGVTVCGKLRCIVLLPDNWEWNKNGVGDKWQMIDDKIQYSEETEIKWSTMEAAGAVCLPAAGTREGSGSSSVYDGSNYGRYWSSTANGSLSAYRLNFKSNGVDTDLYGSRYYGYSVRLVTDVSAAPTPKDALFSVSLYKKVKFTKGNLYWNGSSYQFENNQYDYRHYNDISGDTAVINGETTTTPSGTVGSFWCISNDEEVGKPYNKTYTTPTGSSNYLFTDESNNIMGQSKANQNFAVNGESGKYQVLSRVEWEYLLNLNNGSGRSTASNLFAKARVHNVDGLLIFPDDYILPSGYTKTGGGEGMAVINNKTAMFPETSIPDVVWSTMEFDGVVFLPAAGMRSGESVLKIGEFGSYLTSLLNGSNLTRLFFSGTSDSKNVNCSGNIARSDCAHMIRCVYEEK